MDPLLYLATTCNWLSTSVCVEQTMFLSRDRGHELPLIVDATGVPRDRTARPAVRSLLPHGHARAGAGFAQHRISPRQEKAHGRSGNLASYSLGILLDTGMMQ